MTAIFVMTFSVIGSFPLVFDHVIRVLAVVEIGEDDFHEAAEVFVCTHTLAKKYRCHWVSSGYPPPPRSQIPFAKRF